MKKTQLLDALSYIHVPNGSRFCVDDSGPVKTTRVLGPDQMAGIPMFLAEMKRMVLKAAIQSLDDVSDLNVSVHPHVVRAIDTYYDGRERASAQLVDTETLARERVETHQKLNELFTAQ